MATLASVREFMNTLLTIANDYGQIVNDKRRRLVSIELIMESDAGMTITGHSEEVNVSCGCHPEYKRNSVDVPLHVIDDALNGRDWQTPLREKMRTEREAKVAAHAAEMERLRRWQQDRDRAELERLKKKLGET